MKIYLATLGSLGDNEPFRALAAEAAAAGHDVYFSHTDDVPTDPGAGYTELPLHGSFEALITSQGISLINALRAYTSTIKPMLKHAHDDVVDQILDLVPDVVVYHPKLVTAPVAAHAVGAIAVSVELFPTLTPTAEFPALGFPHTMPGWLNRWSFQVIRRALALAGNPARERAQALGVVRYRPDLTLCPVSTALVPQPADWPAHALITGHWALPSHGVVDDELALFLSEGPIVYAGFGSMKDSRGERRAHTIVEAARELRFKTLLVTGWGGLAPSSEHVDSPDVLVRHSVPHSAILESIGVALHHGGSGTTHAMLRAGVPSVIMPFVADQPWWATRLHRSGLGPPALSRKTTRPSAVVDALVAALERGDAVRNFATVMASEDGLGRALSTLEDAEAGLLGLASD